LVVAAMDVSLLMQILEGLEGIENGNWIAVWDGHSY
jgi:hypothetical protein